MRLFFPVNLPNSLSLCRLFLGFVLPGLILFPEGTLGMGQKNAWACALALFLLGSLTDFYDGWLARRHHLETPLGRVLDPLADKVFILGAMGSFAIKGVYSYWFLAPIFLREVAVTFCRLAWLRQGQAVGAERAGKLKLCLQVASVLSSFLFLFLPTPATLRLNYFLLITAMVLTLGSGYSFLKNNHAFLEGKRFAKAVAALGVGYLRPAPGTYGTLLGIVILPFIAYDPLLHLSVFSVLLLVGYWALRKMGVTDEDPPEVVIDETCGVLLAFWMIPLSWKTIFFGFLLFRLFDVTKIFPLRWLENRKGIHGIMWDDLGAGVYTWLVLKILIQ